MAQSCNAVIDIFTTDCQLQGDHRAVSLILCHDSRSYNMIDMLDTPTLAKLLLGHIKVSTPSACQYMSSESLSVSLDQLTYRCNLVSVSSSWVLLTTFISLGVHFPSALNMPPPLEVCHSIVPVRLYRLFLLRYYERFCSHR
jgi:hypothetical protein